MVRRKISVEQMLLSVKLEKGTFLPFLLYPGLLKQLL